MRPEWKTNIVAVGLLASFMSLTAFGTGAVQADPILRKINSSALCSITFTIRTGNDDLRGGDRDNVSALLSIRGTWLTLNAGRGGLNGGQRWNNWTTHSRTIDIPDCALPLDQITAVRLHTRFTGGISGDNWNVDRLKIAWTGRMISESGGERPIHGSYYDQIALNAERPLFRFRGDRPDWDIPVH